MLMALLQLRFQFRDNLDESLPLFNQFIIRFPYFNQFLPQSIQFVTITSYRLRFNYFLSSGKVFLKLADLLRLLFYYAPEVLFFLARARAPVHFSHCLGVLMHLPLQLLVVLVHCFRLRNQLHHEVV